MSEDRKKESTEHRCGGCVPVATVRGYDNREAIAFLVFKNHAEELHHRADLLQNQVRRYESLVRELLGEGTHFPPRRSDREGAFYWRSWLRRESERITAEAPP